MPLNLLGDLFNILFFAPIINGLALLIRALEQLHISGATGWAIILLSFLLRMIVWPFMSSQMKLAQVRSEHKDKFDALKSKHKDDRQAHAQAEQSLYKELGVNPAGGCVSAIVQIPVFLALYQTVLAFLEGSKGLEKVNYFIYSPSWKLTVTPDLNFLGMNLGHKPSEFATAGVWILAVPLITAGLTFLQSKMMTPKVVKKYPSDSPKEKKEKSGMEDTMSAMQGQMLYMMPAMIGFAAYQFPIGLAIYWNIFSLMGILQQYLLSRK